MKKANYSISYDYNKTMEQSKPIDEEKYQRRQIHFGPKAGVDLEVGDRIRIHEGTVRVEDFGRTDEKHILISWSHPKWDCHQLDTLEIGKIEKVSR